MPAHCLHTSPYAIARRISCLLSKHACNHASLQLALSGIASTPCSKFLSTRDVLSSDSCMVERVASRSPRIPASTRRFLHVCPCSHRQQAFLDKLSHIAKCPFSNCWHDGVRKLARLPSGVVPQRMIPGLHSRAAAITTSE